MAKKAITLDNLPAIAGRLKQIRTTAGKTQTALGAILGLAPAYIQRYESGTIEPPLAYLAWFAQHFQVSIDWIMTGQEPCAEGAQLPAGKDYVDLPLWSQERLAASERNLINWTLEVLRSGDLLPKAANALESSIEALRDAVERDAKRPRAPAREDKGGQGGPSGDGQQVKKRTARSS